MRNDKMTEEKLEYAAPGLIVATIVAAALLGLISGIFVGLAIHAAWGITWI